MVMMLMLLLLMVIMIVLAANRRRKYSNDTLQQGRTESLQYSLWRTLYNPWVTLVHSSQPAGISSMLVFGEGGKPENPEKNPRGREENQQKLNPLSLKCVTTSSQGISFPLLTFQSGRKNVSKRQYLGIREFHVPLRVQMNVLKSHCQ